MNKFLQISAMAALAIAHVGTQAADKSPEQIAKDAGCFTCHSVSEKVVGPSYKAVAEKYKGDKGAADQLVQSVRNGSKGNWGRIPMPAHGSMSEADIRAVVAWVLTR